MLLLRSAFIQLEELYQNLPEIPCISCGLCCVSPHMTLVEFAYLMEKILLNYSQEELIALISKPMITEKLYPGNYTCKMQNGRGLCSIYEYRAIMCHLEGAPILNKIGIRNHEICPYISEDQMKVKIVAKDIDSWAQKTFDISKQFYPIYEEPYWLSALNFESWIAVALDTTFRQKLILQLQKLIRDCIDIDFLETHYRDLTGLATKLDLVDNFFGCAQNRQPRKALKLIKRILNDFPQTGSYYQSEGTKYFDLMKDVVRKQQRRY